MHIFLLIIGIILGIIAIMALISAIIWRNESDDGALAMVVVFLLFGGISALCIGVSVDKFKQKAFDKHKTIEYVKPTIHYFKKYDDKLVILVDGYTLTKTDVKWLNTNNIVLKIEHYNGRTNREYIVVKGE